jgi:hydrogenase maturation protease
VSGSVLVAGIGNIFLSDDGFGVEVANRLKQVGLPEGVRVEDFGIRGVHLAYELLESYDAAVLVDVIDLHDDPGTVAILEARQADMSEGSVVSIDAHSMSPDVVLGTLARLGGNLERIYVVGCQPECLEEGIGLSETVRSAVGDAVELCSQLVAELVRPVGKDQEK